MSLQQNHALNLIWALRKTNKISAGSRVAIIGAGFTGITLLLALRTLDCRVDLFDHQSQPIADLSFAFHRTIHPTINLWPQSELNPTTSLPFLNWYATSASQIAKILQDQLSTSHDKFRAHFGRKVNAIRAEKFGATLVTETNHLPTRFDIVICADDGNTFAESEHTEPDCSSYWTPDNLEKHRCQGHTIVVNGATEGGLIDALRAAYETFDYGRLLFEIAAELSGSELSSQLARDSGYEKDYGRHDLSLLYFNAVERLVTDPQYSTVSRRLRESLARKMPVYLADRSSGAPFLATSAPIHKLLLAFAIHFNAIRFVQEDPQKTDKGWALGQYELPENSVVISRLDHRPIFANLFSPSALSKQLNDQSAVQNLLMKPHWHSAFPHDNANVAQKLFALARRAVRDNFDSDLAVDETGYRILTSQSTPKRLPTEIFGVPLRVGDERVKAENISTPYRKHLFISYAQSDRSIAKRVAKIARQMDISVELEHEEGPDASWLRNVEYKAKTSDSFLILISQAALASPWVVSEFAKAVLSSELRNRGVSVVPLLLEQFRLPAPFNAIQAVSLTDQSDHGCRDLLRALAAAPQVNLRRLKGEEFEDLVDLLLKDIGYKLDSQFSSPRYFGAKEAVFESPDPFGTVRQSRSLLIVKHYRDGRLGVSTLRSALELLKTTPRMENCILVTSSTLTSIARQFLEDHGTVRVIEGPEVSRLLAQRSYLIDRYRWKEMLA